MDHWQQAAAGFLIYAPTTKRFLVGKRSQQVSEPGTWAGFGGKVEPGEDELQGAIRELVEETGFQGDLYPIPGYIYFAPGGTFRYHHFIGIVPEEFPPRLNWETEEARWVTWAELKKLAPKHPGFAHFLKNDFAHIDAIRNPGGGGRTLRPVSKRNPGNLFCSLDPNRAEPLGISSLQRSLLTPGEAVREAKAELKRLKRRKQDLLNEGTRDSRRIAEKVQERIDRTKRQLMLAQRMVDEGKDAADAPTAKHSRSNPSRRVAYYNFKVTGGHRVRAEMEVDEYGYIEVYLSMDGEYVGGMALMPDEKDTVYTVLEAGLSPPLKGKGFYSQKLIPWVRRVLGKPITSHKSHQSLAAEKAWRRVPKVVETPVEFRLNPGRVAITLQAPDGEDRIVFTPHKMRAGGRKRVKRTHSFSEMGGRTDEHLGSETTIVTEQAAKSEIGIKMQAGWEAIEYKRNPRQKQRSLSTMQPYNRRLTADAVATIMEQLDRGSPRKKGGVREDYTGFRKKGDTYLQMWMPLELLSYVPGRISAKRRAVVSDYAVRDEEFPPVLVTWDPKIEKFAVVNGNHRAAAAELRNDRFIQVYVSEADFAKFTSTLPGKPPYLPL